MIIGVFFHVFFSVIPLRFDIVWQPYLMIQCVIYFLTVPTFPRILLRSMQQLCTLCTYSVIHCSQGSVFFSPSVSVILADAQM